MPQQLPHNYPPSQIMNEKNPYASASYSSIQTKPEAPLKNSNKNDANFHHFYGPVSSNKYIIFNFLIIIILTDLAKWC